MNPFSRLANKITLRELYRASQTCIRGTVLDIGCGQKPYAPVIVNAADNYIGLDHPSRLSRLNSVDVIGNALHLGFADDSFDTVICTAVLEHVEEPEKLMQEAFRVLKPGGFAVFGAPLIWPIHEAPRDFFRYTEYGLWYLCDKAGFVNTQIKPMAGYFVTLAYFLIFGLRFINRSFIRKYGILNPLIYVLQEFGWFLDRLIPVKEFSWAYFVICKRPS